MEVVIDAAEQVGKPITDTLEEVIVVSHDARRLGDVGASEDLIWRSLNVNRLVLANDGSDYGVCYFLVPDAGILYKSFGRKSRDVVKACREASQEAIRRVIETGRIEVLGEELSEAGGDCFARATFNSNAPRAYGLAAHCARVIQVLLRVGQKAEAAASSASNLVIRSSHMTGSSSMAAVACGQVPPRRLRRHRCALHEVRVDAVEMRPPPTIGSTCSQPQPDLINNDGDSTC
ncbi:hypothetical protein HK097_011146 [Rhizophlyctis rosea]|uniref:Uncharacterized protein n=1 Tax=Rhizophlyctis rosea TaxID=64517 RepID=A0AAD5S9V6_9FUNG|nr:hypothetical protein HK097_011146 [Rhizophlyctis rosea]